MVVDECAEGSDNCDVNAVCVDTQYAFTCTCTEGYEGLGVVEECEGECKSESDGKGSCML